MEVLYLVTTSLSLSVLVSLCQEEETEKIEEDLKVLYIVSNLTTYSLPTLVFACGCCGVVCTIGYKQYNILSLCHIHTQTMSNSTIPVSYL